MSTATAPLLFDRTTPEQRMAVLRSMAEYISMHKDHPGSYINLFDLMLFMRGTYPDVQLPDITSCVEHMIRKGVCKFNRNKYNGRFYTWHGISKRGYEILNPAPQSAI